MQQSGVVTIVFTDLVDSTGLIKRLGEDGFHAHLAQHMAVLRECTERYGGREVKNLGDGLMLAFASPLDAAVCAAAMQHAMTGPDKLRIGMHTGEPEQDRGDLHGAPVVVARRLCDAADGREILLSSLTGELIGGRRALPFERRGPLILKGLSEPVEALALNWQSVDPASRSSKASSRIRVLLVDDEELVRRGMQLILETERDIEVIGHAPDGASAIELVEELDPDVLLMDIQMPGTDGLQACRVLADRDARARVIILTTFGQDENVYEALEAGASGFLLKSAPSEELLVAIRAVHRGDAMLQPAVMKRLISQFAGRPRFAAPPEDVFGELTPRELEIVKLLARGLSNAEIANDLVISEKTVKSHVAAILMKLGMRDRIQVVVLAHESGFIRSGPA